ncbi:hypothetical protein JYG23_13880 [Sedimentibacter sp. zth1]|uniref:hypothetical protein n=1 Tax=Sedimentibacter sp. zth1 TaxID=2816908 RepID=UPI001A92A6B5|nr:hypothetical protein [Sedimentibacter sp. zth1]QSX05735.1 hypothetical protein JYG23_13880 [Sedimentibacter sp. zth1]
MNKKLTKIVVLIFILIAIIVGCKNIQTSNQQLELSSINDCIEYLTSDECEGRYPGTKGNMNAQNYIMEKMQDCGLESFENNYLFSYEKPIVSISEEETKLEILKKMKLLVSNTEKISLKELAIM